MIELSLDQLGDFVSRLVRAGAPVLGAWLPGLSEDEIRAAFVDIPELSLPQELVTWWQWHGGVDHDRHPSGELGGSSGHAFWSPQTAAKMAVQTTGLGPPGTAQLDHASDPWKFIECVPQSPRTGRFR